ncbi:MAG TPA: M48 family peptidase [Desulfonatronum sp.]|nr:M48 family peptidase [Desulfonatronum sp.]
MLTFRFTLEAPENKLDGRINVGGICVEVTFKRIKNIYLRVLPPAGEVRVSAPRRMSLESVHAFIDSRLDWISRHREMINARRLPPPLQYLDRETLHVWGAPRLLRVVEEDRPPFVELDPSRLILHVRPGTDATDRRKIVEQWRREEVRKAAQSLIAKWEPVMGVKVARVFVRRMKTRWGSCSHCKGTIRLNTGLTARTPQLLEYVVVHEMAHLLEPSHNKRFTTLMDRFLPGWRELRGRLRCGRLE